MYTNPQDFSRPVIGAKPNLTNSNSGNNVTIPAPSPYGPPMGNRPAPSPTMPTEDRRQSLTTSGGATPLVKLYNTPREREMYDNMADLFSIVKTIEALEKAYIRNAINEDQYKTNCVKLITQFKVASNLTKDSIPDLKRFMQDYRLECKAAEKRLQEGIPIATGKPQDETRTVAETVQYFITLMDSLRLNMTAVDHIHPGLTDLLESLSKISTLSPDWEGKVKIRNWLITLNKMKAADELNEEQIRQMLFDLESAYNAFHKSLASR
eukprot:TRINITY_DN1152_c0_g1_i1.p1 TRINITY_DN1152_c0_g1~~TRINITY_DN1152_c0_g1_i1.p1  ORF type:complete len:266 (+),score=64.24 TRINITY_DN1152_c0_g1_i1:131-928(+)